jgi:hypothetical protein
MCMVKWEWGPVTRGRAGGELGPLLGSVAIIGGTGAVLEICVESGVTRNLAPAWVVVVPTGQVLVWVHLIHQVVLGAMLGGRGDK